MNIYYFVLISISVSFCVGIMLNAKVKIAVMGAFIGGICYSILFLSDYSKLGFFIGALVLALLSELMAKLIKTPSTLFIIIGLYPLVPGSGLYKSIMLVIEANYTQALKTGGDAFVNISLMATSIALVSILFGKTIDKKFIN